MKTELSEVETLKREARDLIADWLIIAAEPITPQVERAAIERCARELTILLNQGRELPTRPMSQPPEPQK